jgi:hypothetical protein
MNNKEIVYWSCDSEDENLSHTEIEEAILEELNKYPKTDLPKYIEVYGFKRKNLSNDIRNSLARMVAESVNERLDEIYGGPDYYADVTKPMLVLSEKFVNDFFKLYDVWACEVVETITINVKEWRQQNERNY